MKLDYLSFISENSTIQVLSPTALKINHAVSILMKEEPRTLKPFSLTSVLRKVMKHISESIPKFITSKQIIKFTKVNLA